MVLTSCAKKRDGGIGIKFVEVKGERAEAEKEKVRSESVSIPRKKGERPEN